ncbi:MAG: formylmethanofuran--tetrahydromethanopterin N-formyltransferase [Planctomycetaceae bacterium]|nr:formylmethanofuran--tetrahydromethanopterin N-formyltransferase [Planctomycetaceae bacterium]
MNLNGTYIDDTFAEAFRMQYARLVLTAHDRFWLEAAVRELTGYSSSVIACDAECGLESWVAPELTLDGRPGATVLMFGFDKERLATAVSNRVGQCVMTCPSTAVFDGLPASTSRLPLGKHLRFFGDGYQKSKLVGNKRYWRIPVMDGEFLVVENVGMAPGVAGGNFILQARDHATALEAARQAVEAIETLEGVITPFPAGVARSGSKVGSRYPSLVASTADAFCPTLRGRVESRLHAEANCAYEVVIDGVHQEAVQSAMVRGIQQASRQGVVAISAGNYGGKLGKFHLKLRSLMDGSRDP